MGKVFGVTSGKGGVGKSTVSVGLALGFADAGKRVLLVDMDEGLRCLDLMLGIDKTAVFDLSDLLSGTALEDVVYPSPLKEGLFLIPAPSAIGRLDAFELSKLAVTLKEEYDIVIFDFPAGVDFRFYTCLPRDTLFITVATPDPVSVRDAAAVSSRLYDMELVSRLIINRFQFKESRKYKQKNIDGIIDTASLRLLGLVPESEELRMFSLNHKLSRRGKGAAAFRRIVKRLSGENILLPKLKKI